MGAILSKEHPQRFWAFIARFLYPTVDPSTGVAEEVDYRKAKYAAEVLTQQPKMAKAIPRVHGTADEEVREAAHLKLGIDSTNCYNYGFAGNSGVGKSSLINAMRGVTNKDPTAAKTGIEEQTTKITPYPHPAAPHIVLWDIPGCSGQTATARDYFKHFGLSSFDCIVIVVSETLQGVDMFIAKAAEAASVDVTFVRSKSDESVKNSITDGYDWEDAVIATRDSNRFIRKALDGASLQGSPLFLVSAPVMRDMVADCAQGKELKTEEDYKKREDGWMRFDETLLFAHVIESVRDRTSFAKRKDIQRHLSLGEMPAILTPAGTEILEDALQEPH